MGLSNKINFDKKLETTNQFICWLRDPELSRKSAKRLITLRIFALLFEFPLRFLVPVSRSNVPTGNGLARGTQPRDERKLKVRAAPGQYSRATTEGLNYSETA